MIRRKRTKIKPLFEKRQKKWEKEWQGMPEFHHENLKPIKQIIISFDTIEDMKEFSKLIDQKITLHTQSIWFPKQEITTYIDKRYSDKT